MNVSEVLALPSFEGAEVIAGQFGLSREVSTAMVVEAPDIDAWGKQGQLLITSFYAFEDLDDEGLRAFFSTAERIGIGGIVFKPERLVAAAPPQMLRLCDEYCIPLVQVRAGTKYDGLLLDVLGSFLESNINLLNRFFELHRKSMLLALRQPSVLQILLTLRTSVHCDVTLHDASRNRRTSTSEELSGFSSIEVTELAGDQYRTYRYFDAFLAYPDIERRATAVLVPSTDGRTYRLILHARSEVLTPFDVMAIENVVSLLQMELLKQNALDRQLFYRSNGLVHELLVDETLDDERLMGTLGTLGLAQHPLYELLLVRVDLDDPADDDRRADVLTAVHRRIKRLDGASAFYESNDSVVFVHNVKDETRRYDVDAVRAALAGATADPSAPKLSYFAALSSLANARGIAGLNREVGETARFLDSPRYRDSVVRYEDLGVYKLLMQAADRSELARFVDPRAASLRAQSPEFFETAVALCNNNLNYQETARELYVHPKTIRYRAERVDRLYGIDFHNPEDRLQLALAARVFSLLDAPKEGK